MTKRTNQLANQNADNEHSVPNEPNLQTGANPTSTEPPCVSNHHENRLVQQSSPIDSVPPTSHKQHDAMPQKTELTQYRTAKDTSQIVPNTGAHLPSKRIPRLTLVKRGDQEMLSADTTDLTEWYDELAAAFASKNKDLCMGILRDITIATSNSPGADAANSTLSFVAELKPREPLEARLAVQIDAANDAVIKAKQRIEMAKTEPQLDGAVNRFTKLTRASCGLVLAFKNYRTAPPHTVTVQQNVSVSDGGQAIVGNVTQAPGGMASAADPAPVTINGTALPLNDDQKEEPDAVQPLDKGDVSESHT